MTTRVVVLRGTAANPWDLRPWESLGPEFEATVLVPPNNQYDVSGLELAAARVETVGGRLPSGRVGGLLTRAIGERYLALEKHLAGADIVHAAELGYWFTAQAARLRAKLGFRLVVTVWETLPFASAYRNVRTRPYRDAVLAATDLFLPDHRASARGSRCSRELLQTRSRSRRRGSTSTASPQPGRPARRARPISSCRSGGSSGRRGIRT